MYIYITNFNCTRRLAQGNISYLFLLLELFECVFKDEDTSISATIMYINHFVFWYC